MNELLCGRGTGPEWQRDAAVSGSTRVSSRPLSQGPGSFQLTAALVLFVCTRMQDGVFSQHLLAEKANIQKYFDNDILQFPEAV